MLVELSVVEQRHHAVMEVLACGVPVTEVAERYGVSRKSVHAWLDRYRAEGWPACRIGRIARMRASFPVSRRGRGAAGGDAAGSPEVGSSPAAVRAREVRAWRRQDYMFGGSAWRRCSCGRPRMTLNVKRG